MLSIWIAAAIGAAAAIGGGLLGAGANRAEASKQRDWAAQQYGQRYQVTMNDMRAAGLNPMLAYSQGVGTSPTGTAAQIGDFGGAAAGNVLAQGGIRSAQKTQAQQQAVLADTVERKTNEEIVTARQNARLARMKADDYKMAGDSILGRQFITAVRTGTAGSKKLDKARAARPKATSFDDVLRDAQRKKRARRLSVPAPKRKPAPYKYRKPKKGEKAGYYFSGKGPRK